ncbi:MAG: exopolyphosphatase [Desulfobacterales bacterium]|nr:exopolyphosphatase [Desulfobacterales bacterium]
MINALKFAAIDIGSNAVRLLLAGVFEIDGQTAYRKMSLTRMPIRLGGDAFALNRISDAKADELVRTMVGFKHLIDAYQPIAYQAYATSAMRGARNGPAICKRVEKACGIHIDIIDGQREAQLIFENKSSERFGGFKHYLYVDVGGGSTELTLFSGGKIALSKSFDIGTIRMLQGGVTKNQWRAMRQWLKTHTAKMRSIAIIGSGGNINKIFSLAGCKNGSALTQAKLQKVRNALAARSHEQRILQVGLRPDRADVIVPAADIYLNLSQWAGLEKIFVPVVGLADGAVRLLYSRYKEMLPKAGPATGKILGVRTKKAVK